MINLLLLRQRRLFGRGHGLGWVSLCLLVLGLSGCLEGSKSTQSETTTTTTESTPVDTTTTPVTNVKYDTSTSVTADDTYIRIGGLVSGLVGTVVLQNNLGDDLTLNQNGSFVFSTAYSSTTPYSVTVKQNPSSQTCVVSNGTGNATTRISTVSVSCSGNGTSSTTTQIRQVEVAQLFSQTPNATYQRLVPGRRTLVRAFVYANNNVGAAMPAVTVTAITNGTVQGTATMTCPAALAQAPTTIKSAVLADSCHAELDGAWIGQGLTLKVVAGSSIASYTPTIQTTARRMELVVVPIVVKGVTPEIPSVLSIKQQLYKHLPFAYNQIGVTVRAAYTPTSTKVPLGSAWWSEIVDEINELRITEDPNTTKFYYGMLPYSSTVGGYLGLGFVNETTTMFYPTAVGYNGAENNDWAKIMTHELSHNLSAFHAPCGRNVNVTQIDPNYPGWTSTSGIAESSGFTRLGSTPIYAQIDDVLFDPSASTEVDLMGYCEGHWLSEYNLFRLTTFLNTNGVAALKSAITSAMQSSNAVDQIRISGRIAADAVTLSPVKSVRDQPYNDNIGDYTLQLVLADGSERIQQFTPSQMGEAVGSRYFSLVMEQPASSINKIRIYDPDGQAFNVITSQKTTAALANAEVAPLIKTDELNVRDTGDKLVVSWNKTSYPSLQIVYVASDNSRQLVGNNLTGGTAKLTKVPAGGSLEFSFTDGINSTLKRLSY